MISSEFIEYTKKNISEMPDVVITEEKFENENKALSLKLLHDGKTFLLRMQDESDEHGELDHIFSINYMLRIKQLPKTKKEIDILRAVNKFNEQYAISKCIFVKRDNDAGVFWFRSEFLTDKETNKGIIENTLGSLKTAPGLLTEILRGQ